MKWCLGLITGALLFGAFVAGSPAAQREPRLLQTGTISGTLLTRQGKPASGVRVAALAAPAGDPDANTGTSMSAFSIGQTDAEGRYRLEDLPAGNYVVTAGLFAVATFFPGVSEQGKARVVTVEAGAHLAATDFKLASTWFSGRVVRQDLTTVGNLPAGERSDPASPPIQAIRLQNLRNEFTALVGEDGAFAFPTLRPGEYQLTTVPDTNPMLSPITVTLAESDVTDFELTLPWVVLSWSATVEENAPLPRIGVRFISTGQSPEVVSGAALTVASTLQSGLNPFGGQVVGTRNTSVPTGIYKVIVDGLPKPFFVKSITSGSRDLAVSPLKANTSGVPSIKILLGVSGTPTWPSITGRFGGRGTWAGQSWGTVSGPRVSQPAIVDYLDGSFEIPRLVPGTYTLPGVSRSPGEPRCNEIVVGDKNVENAVIDTLATFLPPTFTPLPGGDNLCKTSTAPPITVVRPTFTGAPAGPRLSGQIVGRARVVTGVKYEVRLRSGGSEWWFAAPIYADGSFEFEHVPPGTYSAEVVPAIPGASPTTIIVGAEDMKVNVAVPATRDIIGQVDPGAGPLPRVVTFSVASQRVRVDLQAEGRFTIVLPDGLAVGIVPNSLPAGFIADSVILAKAAGLPELRVVLKTEPTVAVRGRVRLDAAGPDGLLAVLVDNNNLLRRMEVPVHNDGVFEFSKVLPGAYTLGLVRGPIAATTARVSIVVTSGMDVEGLELIPGTVNPPGLE